MRIPVATYRLQFGPSLGFRQAREAAGYLDALGITDVYASPLLAARPGSTHGYDVVDPTRLNPELGMHGEFDELVGELRRRNMGIVLDVVPNHMAADEANPWWMDVLERGRSSPHASTFDIDWEAPGLEGRLLVPVLGAPLGQVLDEGDLRVEHHRGRPVIRYHEHRFPVAPGSVDGAVGPGSDPVDRSMLERLLDAQPYRLAYWREAMTGINYRRFFDITDLVSVRTEEPEVLEATHRVVVGMARRGEVAGLRIDHVDGLRDPLGYLRWVRERCGDVYVVVEKILGPGETVPGDWPVAGTTGYDTMGQLTRLLVDGEGLGRLGELAQEVGGPQQAEPFDDVVVGCKRQVAEELFAGEVTSLARHLHRLVSAAGGGPSVEELRRAIVEVSAALPVYRTYLRGVEASERDRRYIEGAAARAAAVDERLGPAVELLRQVLLLESPSAATPEARLDFAMRWQQVTGPLAAKGLEDTALYRWNRLVALNEVGGDPGAGALNVEEFHRAMEARARGWPHAMTATATHDAKRSEDVRARIAVLSEVPEEWEAAVRRWRQLGRPHRGTVRGHPVPDGAEELLLFQSLLGVWPATGDGPDADLVERLVSYMVKAAREAKVHTSWIRIDRDHEEALSAFIRDLLADRRFVDEVSAVARRVALHGAVNALAQVLVKVAAPGVPDLYQGTEGWHLRLVDPDNRVPVDFAAHERTLRELDRRAAQDRLGLVDDVVSAWQDGRVKIMVTSGALRFRRDRAALFQQGGYVPLWAGGDREEHVCAFARRHGGAWAVAAVPRLTVRLGPRFPTGTRAWGDDRLTLPAGAPGRWRNALTGEVLRSAEGSLPLAEVFGRLPVALLGGDPGEETGARF